MKKIFVIGTMFALLLTAAYGFAEMGGGQKGQMGGMEKGQMNGHDGMMEHGQMMSGMMDMSKQMSDMMGNVSGMMNNMPRDRMKHMAPLMNQMSGQMMEMSKMMDKGTMTEKDMKKLREHMGKLQNMMTDIEKKK